MFSGLRENSVFYILDKADKPTLKIGQVISVSNAQPKFPSYQGSYAPPVETTVDVKVKVGDEELEFKQLPSSGQIANSGAVVVSESKDAMSAEVDAMLRNSRSIIESVDYHKGVAASCEEIISELNPRIAKEKEQEKKISNLEEKMEGVEDALTDIKGMLKKALGKSAT